MQGCVRLWRLGEVLAALALPAAGAVFLHRLGQRPGLRVDWSDLDLWLQVTPLADVLASFGRLAGLAAACWVVASTLAYLVAVASGLPAAVRAVEWATLPVVRRAADRAIAVVLAGSAAAAGTGPAVASAAATWPPPATHTDTDPLTGDTAFPLPASRTPGPAPARLQAGVGIPVPTAAGVLPDEPGITVSGRSPAPAAPEASPPGDHDPAGDAGNDEDDASPTAAAATAPAVEADAPATAVQPGPQTHDVVAGDNLWSIAERTLARAWSRPPTAAETAAYWRELIDLNRARLRSGDPDLIHPGERLALPTVPASEEAADG